MKTLEEMIEVMEAFKNGKKIEWKSLNSVETLYSVDDWSETADPSWNWGLYDFRVKKETKYRPYADTEEMINDFCNRFHITRTTFGEPFIWVKSNGYKLLCSAFLMDVVNLDGSEEELDELLDNYTYLDGSPCGMKVEE